MAQGLATPLIAFWIGVITTQIQRQQSQSQQRQADTSHLQYRLALFDRRMRVFDATLDFIALVCREAQIKDLATLFNFLQTTREHPLLFGPEIGGYIDELYKKGVRLQTVYACRLPTGAIRPEDIPTDTEINTWFTNQTKVAQDKFLKYIDFRKP